VATYAWPTWRGCLPAWALRGLRHRQTLQTRPRRPAAAAAAAAAGRQTHQSRPRPAAAQRRQRRSHPAGPPAAAVAAAWPVQRRQNCWGLPAHCHQAPIRPLGWPEPQTPSRPARRRPWLPAGQSRTPGLPAGQNLGWRACQSLQPEEKTRSGEPAEKKRNTPKRAGSNSPPSIARMQRGGYLTAQGAGRQVFSQGAW
jgi:hypothetical protein